MDRLLRDLRIAPSGDLAVTATGDLDTLRGAANVGQAALRRLLRAPGSLAWAPEYGAGLLSQLERLNTPGLRRMAEQLGRAALLDDPRIADVRVAASTAAADPHRVDVLVEGTTITGEAIRTREEVPL